MPFPAMPGGAFRSRVWSKTRSISASLTARAEVQRDHAKAAAIWRATDTMWWHGPDDPNVCLLRITPITAELWDGPASKAVAVFEFLKSRLTGQPPNLGENRKITVDLR
jgi:Pyridoxamine 5'-phosphate oxidase like